MNESMHHPLTMNQAKDLARDGKKRPLERGVGNTLEQAVREMEKVEDEEVDIFTRNEEKKQKRSPRRVLTPLPSAMNSSSSRRRRSIR